MEKNKPQKQNIGNAGEYYLASYLSAHNFVTTITLGRNEKYDLLVVNPKGNTIKISVKSMIKKSKSFFLSEKYEKLEEPNLFYAFISLNEFKSEPDFWIVPSKVVAKSITKNYTKWFNSPNKEGGKHNSTPSRNFNVYQNKYEPEGWEEEVKKYYKNIKILEDF